MLLRATAMTAQSEDLYPFRSPPLKDPLVTVIDRWTEQRNGVTVHCVEAACPDAEPGTLIGYGASFEGAEAAVCDLVSRYEPSSWKTAPA